MIRIEERKTVKLPGITSFFVTFDFNKQIVEELKLLSNTYYNADTKEWEIPLTSLSEFIDRVCKLDSINLKVMKDARTETTEDNELDLNNYKTQPFPYQKEGILWGLNHDSWLLLDAPGLGKSLQLMYLAQELKRRGKVHKCLVICGINTLKTNWKAEIEKHSDLSCTILGQRITRTGKFVIDGIDKRVQQLMNPIDEFFTITNIETLRSDKVINAINKNQHNKFDMIILDEAHVCLSPDALVETDTGSFRIEDVVKNRLNCKIKSFDESTGSIVYKQITDYHETLTKKPIIRIEVEDDGVVKSLDCTIDHQICTRNRGFVPAMFLTEEDDIIIDF